MVSGLFSMAQLSAAALAGQPKIKAIVQMVLLEFDDRGCFEGLANGLGKALA